MSGLTFEVRAIPGPQGSKNQWGGESSAKVKPWREAVRSEAVAAIIATGDKRAAMGPVAVIIRFSLPRPKSHYRTGRNAGVLRDDAPGYCSKRPDVDKLVRSTLDALTAAGLYGDDAQVAVLEVEKRYADPDPVGAVITVSAL
jgi:Holliday junction resolvase RusA-like endonuclease